MTIFRKIALGTWRTEYDPSVYGTLAFRADAALEYIRRFREVTGVRLTLSQLMAKALAAALVEVPEANAIQRWGKLWLRESVDICFQVMLTDDDEADPPSSAEPSGKKRKFDLSAVVLRNVAGRDLRDLAEEMQREVDRARRRENKELERTRGTFKWLPQILIHRILNVVSFLSYTLNLDLRWAGLPKDPFGSAMVTNIGALGLESAYVPLVPYSRCPLLVALGAVTDEPVIENGHVVPGKMLRAFATFDHRIMDGAHAAVMSRVIKAHFDRPFEHFGIVTP